MMLYIATKSFKHILNNYKVIDRVGTTAKLKITMGHNSTKKEGGVMILFSAYQLMMLYICTMFCENICNGFKLQSGHDFHFLNYKGA